MTHPDHTPTSTDTAMWGNDPELEHAEHFNDPPGSWLGWVIIGSVLFWVFVGLWAVGAWT